MPSVLMLAAEHGGLPGGKVGGIGDVIEHMPPALAAHLRAAQKTKRDLKGELKRDTEATVVDVLLPSYGSYHRSSDEFGSPTHPPKHPPKHIADAWVAFAGSKQKVALYRLPRRDGAGCLVIDHPLFAAPAGQIYHDDPATQPFATDANIYALFCAAAIQLLKDGSLATPDVVHLHDWHAATFALLARGTEALSGLTLVYTIHNLALQGIRPLEGHPSSLTGWFPDIDTSAEYLRDPRYTDCYNPARAAIRLADKVHVVSPTYAEEVLEANNPDIGLHGGEGLEADLQLRADSGDLIGILNGCEYPDDLRPVAGVADRQLLQAQMQRSLADWMGAHDALRTSDFLARETVAGLAGVLSGRFLLTSVGRLTPQKVGLLLHTNAPANETLLDRLLDVLGDTGVFILLGSGDANLEGQLVGHAARHSNFIFLRGYSDPLAELLYQCGDLFLMPSLFEPCGISQLLAMRCGQPCLVHATGGLKDTVEDGVDGFSFSGVDLADKAIQCELSLKRALRVRADVSHYRKIREAARAKRITWSDAAQRYADELFHF